MDTLAKWPRGSLPSLSIIQDPIPVDPNPEPSSPSSTSSVLSLSSALAARNNGKRSFAHAQPLVFFRLDHALSNLLHSPALSGMRSLRLRVPSRPIARALCAGNVNLGVGMGGMGVALQSAPATSSLVEEDDEERTGGDGAESERSEQVGGGQGQGCTSTLKFLDVSTCGLLDTEIDHILEKFPVLQHLVMDRCATMGNGLGPNVGTTPGSSVGLGRGPNAGGGVAAGGGGRPGSAPARGSSARSGAGGNGNGSGSEWVSLGRRCALVGVRRAKEREKTIKVVQAHLQAQMQGAGLGLGQPLGQAPVHGQVPAQALGQPHGQAQNTGRRPPAKPGRKGLSTATISLREDSGVNVLASVPVMSSMPPSSSSASHSHTPGSTSTNVFGDNWRLSRSRIRILPPPPSLRSLCLTVPFVSPSEDDGSSPGSGSGVPGEKEYHDFLRKEFSVGWKEGLASLEVIRGRMRRMAATSSSNHNAEPAAGTKTMRFVGTAGVGGGGGYSGWLEGLEDLREAEERESETNGVVRDELWDVPVPVLCFAGLEEGEHGSGNGIKHEAGCGHLFSATSSSRR